MKVVVLCSGGLDSVTVLRHAAEEHAVDAVLSFDYGAKHNHRELPFAEEQAVELGVPHEVICLDFIDQVFKSDLLRSGGGIPDGHYEEATMKQTVVPFRNGIFLAAAAGFAESRDAEALVIAAHSGDHAIYPDCREEFMAAMADAIRTGTYGKLVLMRPFVRMTKAEIVRRAVELGVDFAKTWSCYKGLKLHCGACGTCVERREAFLLAGVKDPTAYESAPPLPAKPTR